MTLLDPLALRSLLNLPDSAPLAALTAACEVAEALVSGFVGASLVEREARQNFFARRELPAIALDDGPLAGLSELRVDGLVVPASGFSWVVYPREQIAPGSRVEVSFTAGFSRETLPGLVRAALLLTAAALASRPDVTLVAEALGDVNARYRTFPVLPDAAMSCLRAFRRP